MNLGSDKPQRSRREPAIADVVRLGRDRDTRTLSPNEHTIEDATVVLAFNEAINDRDVSRLAELMTPGHRFIDSEGRTVHGQNDCVDAWRDFFASFPDYRNIFDDVAAVAAGTVVARVAPSAASPHSTDPRSGAPKFAAGASASGRSPSLLYVVLDPAFG